MHWCHVRREFLALIDGNNAGCLYWSIYFTQCFGGLYVVTDDFSSLGYIQYSEHQSTSRWISNIFNPDVAEGFRGVG